MPAEQSMSTIQRRAGSRAHQCGGHPAARRISSASTTARTSSRSRPTPSCANMAIGIGLIFVLQWLFLGNLRTALIVGATILRRCSSRWTMRCAAHPSTCSRSKPSTGLTRGRDRDHGGEHLPGRPRRSRRARLPGDFDSTRRVGANFRGKLLAIFHAATECQSSDLLCRRHHHRGFAAIHAERRRGLHSRLRRRPTPTRWRAPPSATFTVTPVPCAVFLPEHVRETETRLMRGLHLLQRLLLRFAVGNWSWSSPALATVLALAGVTVRLLGLEFLPKLEE